MKPRLTMAIAIAVPIAFAAMGTTLALAAGVTKPPPIKELLSPSPSPTADHQQLPKPLQQVIADAQASTEEATAPKDGGSNGSTDGQSTTSSKNAPNDATASDASNASPSWTMPLGGFRRFLNSVDAGYPTGPATYTASVPTQAFAPSGTATITRVATSLPQSPAYLWLLVPLSVLALWAASLAVFEPTEEPGGVAVLVRSVRHTARELPAGMIRSVGRAAVHGVRALRQWPRR